MESLDGADQIGGHSNDPQIAQFAQIAWMSQRIFCLLPFALCLSSVPCSFERLDRVAGRMV
jgi:hypothetical protein